MSFSRFAGHQVARAQSIDSIGQTLHEPRGEGERLTVSHHMLSRNRWKYRAEYK